MNCPIENNESAELLLAWCTRSLDPESAAALERHLEACPECRRMADGQKAIWRALDEWEAAPVTVDFDRRLYARIAREVSWWERLVRPFRPMLVRQGLPIAAAACLAIVAGILIDQTEKTPGGMMAPTETVQVDQVEDQLHDMELLRDFSRTLRADAAQSKI